LEKYRRPGRKFQNVFTAKSKIRDRNQSRLLATVITGEFTTLGRSALGFDAHGAVSFDKFSTQKRRTEKTAKSALGDNKSPAAIPNPGILRAGVGDPAGIFAFPSHYLASIHVAL
jgi:hypothetical protein